MSKVGCDVNAVCVNVLFPQQLDKFVSEEFLPKLDRILTEDGAEDGLEPGKVPLEGGDSFEELVEVGR